MSTAEIRPLEKSEHLAATGLLMHLSPDCSAEVIIQRFRTILAEHPHYHPIGAFSDGKLVAFVGAWVATKLWCGRYLEIDNFIVDPDFREQGLGTQLTDHLESLAKQQDCNLLVLDSYTSNHQSHRLYHRLGFEIWGFHFVKTIASLDR